MGYFYRAVNEHEISNNHNGYLCNLNIHKNDTEKMKKAFKKIINEVFGKNLTGDFSLAIDRIIGHIQKILIMLLENILYPKMEIIILTIIVKK